MERPPSVVWADGELHADGAIPQRLRDHMGLVLGISPTAYIDVGPVEASALWTFHIDSLSRGAEALGYSGFDDEAVRQQLSSLDPGLWQVTLVPTPESHKAAPPRDFWSMKIQPASRPKSPRAGWRLAMSEFRRNETSPAASVLLFEDTELRAGASQEEGVDATLWLNLAGHVASADQHSLFALMCGEIVTPPLTDGALDTGWRGALRTDTNVRESNIDLATLVEAESLACLTPRGDVHVVESFGDHCYSSRSAAESLRNTLKKWRPDDQ